MSLAATAGDSSRRTLAFAALLLGAAAIAFAPIFVRLSDTSPGASAFWRMALAAVPLWLWQLASRRAGGNRPLPWKALTVAGACFAGDLGAWHTALLYTSVANSTLEANLAPIFVTLGAWLLFRQRVSRLFLVALAVTLSGAVRRRPGAGLCPRPCAGRTRSRCRENARRRTVRNS